MNFLCENIHFLKIREIHRIVKKPQASQPRREVTSNIVISADRFWTIFVKTGHLDKFTEVRGAGGFARARARLELLQWGFTDDLSLESMVNHTIHDQNRGFRGGSEWFWPDPVLNPRFKTREIVVVHRQFSLVRSPWFPWKSTILARPSWSKRPFWGSWSAGGFGSELEGKPSNP